ncbi:MAG TPA: NAD(P)/FAD-dependent oxidoreductase [Ktedonobacteraceae bacterium]|nr:NAD(P)/FAD-dependent oxidoreductase [Ktedonobacteraceae bacterium]
MSREQAHEAVVVGSGPNGLAAAIVLAQVGHSVRIYEAKETIGGGCRTAEVTLPGFLSDICSAVHPLGIGSPFMRTLPLEQYGLEWIQPPILLAHPQDDGTAAVLERSVELTADKLGQDGAAYRRLMGPLVANWSRLEGALLGPLRIPRFPFSLAHFGVLAIGSARSLAEHTFKGTHARALFAGMCAHSMLPLEQAPSASFGLVLGILGHVFGWPVPRGGSQHIVDALAAHLRSLGGEIVTGEEIKHIDDFSSARAILFDVTPRQLLRIAGEQLPGGYRNKLARYRYGPGVCKVDFALDGPIPWQAEACTQAGTVHVGGTLPEIAAAECAIWHDEHPERPFVVLAQSSLFDATRAPQGMHTAWTYCHVPNGSTCDMSERITAQIERFAPGFRKRILAKHVFTAAELERYNPNYVGGDINGGIQDFWQLYTRPTIQFVPYNTPNKRIYICSSSTPPGGGVHGMCGYFAAQSALRRAL